jgi:hypothetical protein
MACNGKPVFCQRMPLCVSTVDHSKKEPIFRHRRMASFLKNSAITDEILKRVFSFGPSMQAKTSSSELHHFFPEDVMAAIRSEHRALVDVARRNIVQNCALSDMDISRVESESRRQLEERIDASSRDGLNAFLEAARNVVVQRETKGIAVPPFIVLDRKPKSEEQKLLRALLKRWLYSTGGIGQVHSGLAAKRVKAFTWLASTDLSIALERPVQCPACESQGALTLHTTTRMAFRCQCGHRDEIETDAIKPKASIVRPADVCTCAFCQQRNRDFAVTLRRILAEAEPAMAARATQWAQALDSRTKIARSSSVPDREGMRRDYLVQQNNISASLRGILAMTPKDGEDFRRCVDQMLESRRSNGPLHKARRQIIDEAVKRKLLYGYRAIHHTDVDDLAKSFASEAHIFYSTSNSLGTISTSYDTKNSEAKLRALHEMLFHGPISELQQAIELQDTGVVVRLNSCKISLFDELDHGTIFSTQIRSSEGIAYVLNPYFISGLSGPVHEPKGTSISSQNLFNSLTEKRAYVRLTMENPGSVVVPNRLLIQVIGRQRMKSDIAPAFDQKDQAYLFKCELDFAVYDIEGNLLFVEEMQRGPHHNHAEWIRKDALKRAALGLAGIPFRESY